MPNQKGLRRKGHGRQASRPSTRRELTVVDLFSGCGGMSLGFHRAGYCIAAGLDHDLTAARTFAVNFGTRSSDRGSGFSVITLDIDQISPGDFSGMALGAKRPEGNVDVLIGGPPCQAFARIGRAKLRETMNHRHAYLRDRRASLYTYFLWYAEVMRPRAILLENVPDIMNYGGKNVAEEIAISLEELGYVARYTVLNSAHYGVPQTRPRLFLMALRKDLGVEPRFPKPSTYIRLPKGYWDAQRTNLRQLTLFGDALHYVEPPAATEDLPRAISVREAIGDLPAITGHLIRTISGARRFDTLARYRKGRSRLAYAEEMRSWPCFENGDGVFDHVIRYLPRDHRIFRQMTPGGDYPAGHDIAVRLFEAEVARRERRSGSILREHSAEYVELRAAFVPPYAVEKFPDKWRKLDPDRPSHTLTAHLGKDTYSHIHYDSAQARVISVREAARLQSFPDGFVFEGAMNSAFRQIGNAVPPLQAYALAREIARLLAMVGRGRSR
jgi:DNA (cytosine-5)-methyltransferase 1